MILNFKIFCVINVKYKEISWRVRRKRRRRRKKERERILKFISIYLFKLMQNISKFHG